MVWDSGACGVYATAVPPPSYRDTGTAHVANEARDASSQLRIMLMAAIPLVVVVLLLVVKLLAQIPSSASHSCGAPLDSDGRRSKRRSSCGLVVGNIILLPFAS